MALLLPSAGAKPEIAAVFSARAVLQRGRPHPAWGWADPGESIEVRFKGQSLQTIADEAGAWQVELQPLEASAEPATLEVRGNGSVTVQDLVVGEVWVAGGQSNMRWPVSRSVNGAAEVAAANWPAIRIHRVQSLAPHSPREFLISAGNPAS